MPLSRKYRGDIFFQKRRLLGRWYNDTFHGRHKYVDGNTVSHFFANKKMFAFFYPLKSMLVKL